MKTIGITCFFLAIYLTGCQTTNTVKIGDWETRKSYLIFMGCVNSHAPEGAVETKQFEKAVREGIVACDKELEVYTDDVLSDVMRRNQWSSLDPNVRPAMIEEIKASTLEVLTKIHLD